MRYREDIASVGKSFTQISRHLQWQFSSFLEKRGLTISRVRVMMEIARHEGATQSELATLLRIEQPSVVGLIDALEKAGMVVRRQSRTDRRAKSLFLTPRARREIFGILRFAVQVRRMAFSGVDLERLAAARSAIEGIAANLEKMNATGAVKPYQHGGMGNHTRFTALKSL